MMKCDRIAAAILLSAAMIAVSARAVPPPGTLGVDPLNARVDISAVERFAALWKGGAPPSAERLARGYLRNGGRAIEVFTPGRIGSAGRLADKIAVNPQLYRDAIDRCLPWVEATKPMLQSTYLGLKGLWPDRALPEIAMVIGADNSGGTAAPGIQVLGLEVLCRLSSGQSDFEERMRQFFAHETVHTFQDELPESAAKTMLLSVALNEGMADYVAKLVTGRVPAAARDAWASPREALIWRDFQADAATVQAGTESNGKMDDKAQAAFRRWFGNAGSPPEGWPDELGYWVGMRIAEAYVAASTDPHAAIDELLNPRDPAAILARSGYGARFTK